MPYKHSQKCFELCYEHHICRLFRKFPWNYIPSIALTLLSSLQNRFSVLVIDLILRNILFVVLNECLKETYGISVVHKSFRLLILNKLIFELANKYSYDKIRCFAAASHISSAETKTNIMVKNI